MSEIQSKLWNGRKVKEEHSFATKGLQSGCLQAMEYAAEQRLIIGGSVNNGAIGLIVVDKEHMIPGFRKRKYKDLAYPEKMMLSGVITTDTDPGTPAKVILFDSNTIL